MFLGDPKEGKTNNLTFLDLLPLHGFLKRGREKQLCILSLDLVRVLVAVWNTFFSRRFFFSSFLFCFLFFSNLYHPYYTSLRRYHMLVLFVLFLQGLFIHHSSPWCMWLCNKGKVLFVHPYIHVILKRRTFNPLRSLLSCQTSLKNFH